MTYFLNRMVLFFMIFTFAFVDQDAFAAKHGNGGKGKGRGRSQSRHNDEERETPRTMKDQLGAALSEDSDEEEDSRSARPVKDVNQVDDYLMYSLKVKPKDLPKYNASLALYIELGEGLYFKDPDTGNNRRYVWTDGHGNVTYPENWRDVPLSDEFIERGMKLFSPLSYDVLSDVISASLKDDANNSLVVGPAGVGKTHSVKQLAAMLMGIIPEDLKPRVGLGSRATEETRRMMTYLFGNTTAYRINLELLALDPTKKEQAFNKAEAREKEVAMGMYSAATKEFRRTGHRAMMIIDEGQGIGAHIYEALKPALSASGFQDPEDAAARATDMGTSTAVYTTPEELELVLGGDNAKQRRFERTTMKEPSETVAYETVRNSVAKWSSFKRKGYTISDEALWYLVRMRKFLANPPEAMPGVIFKGVRGLFAAPIDSVGFPVPDTHILGTKEVQNYLMSKVGLSQVFFEGADGKPAAQELAAIVKTMVSGQDELVDSISKVLTEWISSGFRRPPVIILGGLSRSGKDTLFNAFQMALYGHSDNEFQFDLSGMKQSGVENLLHGSGPSLPRIAKLLDKNRAGMIALNEMQDLSTDLMDSFKKLIETGEVFPQGNDKNRRVLYHPLWILGQFGEHMFFGQNNADSLETHRRSSQENIEDSMREGKRIYGSELIDAKDRRYGLIGALPTPVIQRGKDFGVVGMTSPLAHINYPAVAAVWGKRFIESAAALSVNVTIDPSIYEIASRIAIETNAGIGGLNGILRDMVAISISQAKTHPYRGLPYIPQGEADISVSADSQGNAVSIMVTHDGNTYAYDYAEISTRKRCEESLKSGEDLNF